MTEWIIGKKLLQFTGNPKYVDWEVYNEQINTGHSIVEAMAAAYKEPASTPTISLVNELIAQLCPKQPKQNSGSFLRQLRRKL